MNRFECIGRITKDIELKSTQNGVKFINSSIAVNRKLKDNNGDQITDFFNFTAWRIMAENISKYCKKGSKVYICGELQNRSYDKEDGTKGYITDIVVSECEFIDTKNNGESKTNTPAEAVPINAGDEDSLPF